MLHPIIDYTRFYSCAQGFLLRFAFTLELPLGLWWLREGGGLVAGRALAIEPLLLPFFLWIDDLSVACTAINREAEIDELDEGVHALIGGQ
jgi:hypothetical protein